MKQAACLFFAIVMAGGAVLAQTGPKRHQFAGKNCFARGHSQSTSGASGTGRYDFSFHGNGGLILKWSGDSGRSVTLQLTYEGVEDNKWLVFKTKGGGTAHIDANAWTGSTRVLSTAGTLIVTTFGKLTCS